ncbi:hypothetical protein C480_19954 [Natrialba aegyptia DSM 13077]|uniref:Uncharacterized protein n=2 Tax=Natrialba aegyptia TaxID=129789 RepID=M0ALK0_9EURY|nr:hypothetical protein C480_19954 [Natrialba aegyptia DSM 13077]
MEPVETMFDAGSSSSEAKCAVMVMKTAGNLAPSRWLTSYRMYSKTNSEMGISESQLSLDEANAVAGMEQPPLLYEGSAKIKVLTREIEAASNRDGIPVVIVDELERRRNRL